jgi:hypothetical protein
VVNQARPFRRPRGRSSRRRGQRLGSGVFLVLLVNVLMMGFCLAAILLSQPAVALVTGTGCVSLSRQLTRRLLS